MENDAPDNIAILTTESLNRSVLNVLSTINDKIDKEVVAKQKMIEEYMVKIMQLERSLEEKDLSITEKQEKLNDCLKQGEGNKQLINKLLGDIERLNQDIEWYKKTYERRSFWGTVKQKFKRENIT